MSVKDYIIHQALLSVADKTGIVEFAQHLHQCGVALLATGNTAALLKEHHLPVTEVSDYTQFPEMMNGRVKTLHPKIHAGILARREQDAATLKEHDIPLIDLVVINLYPFEQTIQKPGCTLEQAIEQIDVGGPTMLRGAAKNHSAVTVLTDPNDYATIIDSLKKHKNTVPFSLRQTLAQKAFAYTAQYDAMIAAYLSKSLAKQLSSETKDNKHHELPDALTIPLKKSQALRYGENPQQAAALYTIPGENAAQQWELKQGKPLSFNNLVDADVAWNCVNTFNPHKACVIVKHANPCGVAIADDLLGAYQLAYHSDSTSAFGGIIAFNQPVDGHTCHAILEQQFVEVIIAPGFTAEALTALTSKPNIRALIMNPASLISAFPYNIKCLDSGILVQERDNMIVDAKDYKVVTKRTPTAAEHQDLLFAWHVVKWVKSNAIVYAKDGRTVGIGAGQTSRISSAELGILKAHEAGLSVKGAVVASDAFYPFRDGVDKAAQAGVTAIIQPGGSMRDAEVIAAADEYGLAMIFTGVRHFRH